MSIMYYLVMQGFYFEMQKISSVANINGKTTKIYICKISRDVLSNLYHFDNS